MRVHEQVYLGLDEIVRRVCVRSHVDLSGKTSCAAEDRRGAVQYSLCVSVSEMALMLQQVAHFGTSGEGKVEIKGRLQHRPHDTAAHPCHAAIE